GSLATAAISSSVPLSTLPRSWGRVERGCQSVRVLPRLEPMECVLECFTFTPVLALLKSSSLRIHLYCASDCLYDVRWLRIIIYNSYIQRFADSRVSGG